jgi:hypothetical protein
MKENVFKSIRDCSVPESREINLFVSFIIFLQLHNVPMADTIYVNTDVIFSIPVTTEIKPVLFPGVSCWIAIIRPVVNRQVQKIVKIMLQTNARVDNFKVPSPEIQ